MLTTWPELPPLANSFSDRDKVSKFNSRTAHVAAMEEPDLPIGRPAPADRQLQPAQADADADPALGQWLKLSAPILPPRGTLCRNRASKVTICRRGPKIGQLTDVCGCNLQHDLLRNRHRAPRAGASGQPGAGPGAG